MKVVIAPDSFKGSLRAKHVGEALATGLRRGLAALGVADPELEVVPLADGGEGTLEALVEATGGALHEARVTGPLGEPVDAAYGVLGDGVTGVVEMATASGLELVPDDRRDPRRTTTYGTGELIRLLAYERKLERLIVGIGGSATNDGGAGMAQALGVRLLDARGQELAGGGGALAHLARIDASGLVTRALGLEVIVACDVDNPLTGPDGASRTYGPQKGATEAMVEELDRNLARYADVLRRDLGRDVEKVPGAGAAGGLGAGLLVFLDAELKRGIDLVLDAVGFDRRLDGADLVITGEGKLDAQTLRAKLPLGVAKRAARRGVPVIAVGGAVEPGAYRLHEHGVVALLSATPGPMPVSQALARAREHLEQTGEELGRLLALRIGFSPR